LAEDLLKVSVQDPSREFFLPRLGSRRQRCFRPHLGLGPIPSEEEGDGQFRCQDTLERVGGNNRFGTFSEFSGADPGNHFPEELQRRAHGFWGSFG